MLDALPERLFALQEPFKFSEILYQEQVVQLVKDKFMACQMQPSPRSFAHLAKALCIYHDFKTDYNPSLPPKDDFIKLALSSEHALLTAFLEKLYNTRLAKRHSSI